MRGRTTGARAAVLYAVLLGLFLMHGNPASAAGSCHGDGRPGRPAASAHAAMPAPSMRPVPMRPVPMPAVPTHRTGSAGPTTGGPAVRAAQPYGTAWHCVSTQARGGAPLPAPGPAPLAGDGAIADPGGPGALPAAGASGRAPPAGGRGLLLKVCVARR
ncbi:hypothetical protein BX265_3279 [Streptomyces sp. TLI_235]|nr:hypothetical protein [Streptomyces sp. TLI_235]PBC78507.1 hypothetical protein BX265_3279 [Streptomyces sp. TLI_235]